MATLSEPAMAVAAEALARARGDWRRAESAVSRLLREARGLPSRERRAAGEAVWGVIRSWRAIELVLGAGAGERERLAALDGLDEALAARLGDIADPIERAAVRHSLPTWLVRRLAAELGPAETEAFGAAVRARAPMVIRANAARVTREALRERLAAEGVAAAPAGRARDGLVLEGHPNVRALASWKEGLFEVQDEGSQLVAELAAPPAGGLAVDGCAGAGGKTLALLSRTPSARVVALDVEGRRLAELRDRARRAGFAVETCVVAAGAAPPARLRDAADRVLVDAPCSGTGVLRRHPALRWSLGEDEARVFPARQVDLCVRFAACVRPGGRLVYVTCSVLRDEDEEVVAEVLRRLPALRLVEALRLWPHRDGTDGFFAAVLERAATAAAAT